MSRLFTLARQLDCLPGTHPVYLETSAPTGKIAAIAAKKLRRRHCNKQKKYEKENENEENTTAVYTRIRT